MRTLLLGLAAAALFAAPAQADGGSHGLTINSGGGFNGGSHHGFDGHRRNRNVVVVGNLGWSDDWALYNNRSFEPDSYNDWWHDRPDRAYPRWMQNNQNCQRVWWSGGGWRC